MAQAKRNKGRPDTMSGLTRNDVDRLFLFEGLGLGPWGLIPTREFSDTMHLLVRKVKDILNDPKTDPLVEHARDLEDRLQV